MIQSLSVMVYSSKGTIVMGNIVMVYFSNEDKLVRGILVIIKKI